MKKIILIIIFIIGSFIIKIPRYEELNNLAIIDTIGIYKENNKTTIILREIIPQKKDNNIIYKYKYYKASSNNLKKALNKIKKSTKKKVYLNKCKTLILDNTYSDDIIIKLKIHPKNIKHIPKDIYKYIKKAT